MGAERELREHIKEMGTPCEAAAEAARRRWAGCAMPLGSLGQLQEDLVQIAALTGSAELCLGERAVLVFCADNGVVAQGVTQAGSEVTAAVARALAAGTTPVCCMAAAARCRVVPIDMGILDFPGAPGVVDSRVANGTGDITQGPALTRGQAAAGILAGIEQVQRQKEAGCEILAVGEMGIANTTTAAAVAAVLLGLPPASLAGRGAGLSDEGLARKRAVLERAVRVNAPNREDPLEVLAKVGGADLAGMCGAFLGGALYRVPMVIDGLISSVAAVLACRLAPAARMALLASHLSTEPAARLLLEELGTKPLIAAGLHLGEGTGAVAALPLLDLALSVYKGCETFAECGIEAYTPQEEKG